MLLGLLVEGELDAADALSFVQRDPFYDQVYQGLALRERRAVEQGVEPAHRGTYELVGDGFGLIVAEFQLRPAGKLDVELPVQVVQAFREQVAVDLVHLVQPEVLAFLFFQLVDAGLDCRQFVAKRLDASRSVLVDAAYDSLENVRLSHCLPDALRHGIFDLVLADAVGVADRAALAAKATAGVVHADDLRPVLRPVHRAACGHRSAAFGASDEPGQQIFPLETLLRHDTLLLPQELYHLP